MYDRIDPAQTRTAMEALRSLGVATAEVRFSGGNDEGFAEAPEYRDADGNDVAVPTSPAYETHEYGGPPLYGKRSTGWKVNEGDWRNENLRDATPDEVKWAQVAQAIQAPIYDRYGSFAGEFYVDGTLTWDVTAGTHKLHGQEEVSHWESFEYEG